MAEDLLAVSLERCACTHLRADHTDWWDDGEQGGMGCSRCTCGDPDDGPFPPTRAELEAEAEWASLLNSAEGRRR